MINDFGGDNKTFASTLFFFFFQQFKLKCSFHNRQVANGHFTVFSAIQAENTILTVGGGVLIEWGHGGKWTRESSC